MTSLNESGQTQTPDYEPRTSNEKNNNLSIHLSLTNIVRVPSGYIAWGELFTKRDDPMSLYVRNVHESSIYASYEWRIPNWFRSPSSVLRIINKDGSSSVVTYFFNNEGHSIKEEVNTKQQKVGLGTWSRMSLGDYDNAHQALDLVESGEFENANRLRAPLLK